MAYELAFWRQLNTHQGSPQLTYERLLNEERMNGIADLDVVAMLDALRAAFPSATREQNGPSEWMTWESPNGADSFQVEWTSQFVGVTCRHVHSDDMNRIIDWAAAFACPLYDRQTDERFAS
jgi:hypothetical protein